ncbi:EF-hand domain-containing protein [Kitasatospora herbaricolor]|jgi:Ca2+-binding EF-hand superfamily protein|uniref:EF-hand domain-containing protein n=1 Tax=Kitasatospora herbaricolor TaxID=68217 RepID=A0ABZ1W4Z9_9ACTN|nr:EF-hand domain-containing protein [Kitasatospora herbaricolor]
MADIEAARQAFERFDINGDGLISAAEYSRVMAELGDPHVSIAVAESVIKASDSNSDGLLSFEEFWASRQR